MSKLITKQLLLNNNYWVLNKDMVQLLGLEGAFLLSNFAEAETMMADKEGWFYQTSDTVEKITTLSRHKQDQAIKKLKELGVIEQSNRGVPPKRYFKINYECLTNQFVKNQQIEVRKIDKLNCKKSATNKESTYKESTYKENIDDSLTSIQKHYIEVLQNIESYPLDIRKDLAYLKTLENRYPTLDIVQAINKFSDYVLDNPFNKNSNHRSQINTSFSKYLEWGGCKKTIETKNIIDDNPFINQG